MTSTEISHYLSLVLSLLFIVALIYFSVRYLSASFRKTVDRLTRRSVVQEVNHLKELDIRIHRAEINRASYLKALEEETDARDEFETLMNSVIKASGGFAMVEAMGEGFSNETAKRLNRVESLLECIVLGVAKRVGDERKAEKMVKDEISLLFFNLDVNNYIPHGVILHNPAERYFAFRNRQNS